MKYSVYYLVLFLLIVTVLIGTALIRLSIIFLEAPFRKMYKLSCITKTIKSIRLQFSFSVFLHSLQLPLIVSHFENSKSINSLQSDIFLMSTVILANHSFPAQLHCNYIWHLNKMLRASIRVLIYWFRSTLELWKIPNHLVVFVLRSVLWQIF